MIRARPLRWLCLFAAGGVCSCTEVNITTVEVMRVEVTPSQASLIPGGTMRLEVEVTDEAGRSLLDRAITWQAIDPQVVTVSSQGLVTAVGVGSTTVVASSEGVTGSAVVTVGQGPVIRLAQDSLTLEGVSGSSAAETAVVKVSNTGGGVLDGISASIAYGPEGAGWLATAMNPTTAPADLGLSARAAGLDVGTYTAEVAVSSPAAANSPQTVRIRFDVGDVDPRIRVSPGVVGFSATQAEPSAAQTLLVTNQGGGRIRKLATRTHYVVGTPGWLKASLTAAVAPTNLELSVDVQGLAVATYEARVDVSSPDAVNSPLTVVVTLTVSEPPPSLGLSAQSLAFVAFHEGPPPALQAVQITNRGGGTLSGIATNVSYSGNVTGWLNRSLAAPRAPTTLTVRPTTTDLAPGTYSATVTISSPEAANSPRSLPVTYQVRPRADLSITQQGTPDPVTAGGKLTYRIVVRNAGPSTATYVVVNEDAPTGLTLDSAVPTRGSYDAALERWTVGTMLVGASETLTLVFSVPQLARTPLTNSVDVTSSEDDPNAANNASTVLVGAIPPWCRLFPFLCPWS